MSYLLALSTPVPSMYALEQSDRTRRSQNIAVRVIPWNKKRPNILYLSPSDSGRCALEEPWSIACAPRPFCKPEDATHDQEPARKSQQKAREHSTVPAHALTQGAAGRCPLQQK